MPAVKVKRTVEVNVDGLGEMIRQARGERTITEVSKLANMSRKGWHDIEAEKAPAVKIETLQKMEAVLGVSFNVEI